MSDMKVNGKYFYGNEISEYGQENHRVDYAAFAKAFDCTVAGNLWSVGWELGEWELVSGGEDAYDAEIFQWFVIDSHGFDICQMNDEIVYYNDKLGVYLWGVTHYGTSWRYVLTDIECYMSDEAYNEWFDSQH